MRYPLLAYFSDLISNNPLNGLDNDGPKLDKFWFWRKCLSVLFTTLLESATKDMDIVRPQSLQLKATKTDKNGNGTKRPYS